MDSIGMVYWNTVELYRRFWVDRMPSAEELSSKLREETEELILELYHESGNHLGLVDEAADVIAVVTGFVSANGFSIDDLEQAMRRNIIKNGNKTPATHKRVNETIVQKDK